MVVLRGRGRSTRVNASVGSLPETNVEGKLGLDTIDLDQTFRGFKEQDQPQGVQELLIHEVRTACAHTASALLAPRFYLRS